MEEARKEPIESSPGLGISPQDMKLKLNESRVACSLLQKQFPELHERIQRIRWKIQRCKEIAKLHAKIVTKCMEEKAVNFEKPFSQKDELKRLFSTCEHDFFRIVESWEEEKRKNEELLAIPLQEHKYEKEELRKFKESLDRSVQVLRNLLNIAKQEMALLRQEFTDLGKILLKHHIPIRFGGDKSTSTQLSPTKKLKLKKDAGSSKEKAICVGDSSDDTPPGSPELPEDMY